MDVAVTLKCLYRRAFILSLVVMPRAAIWDRKNTRVNGGFVLTLTSKETGQGGGESDLVELTHDEHRHPHEVEDAVEEHPEHPWGAGGDLGQVEPEAVLGVAGGAVDPPV